jgi:hypothetical protein
MVTSNATIVADYFLLGDNVKKMKGFDPGPNTILVSKGDGTMDVLSFNNQVNKVIGTDANGDIVLLEITS